MEKNLTKKNDYEQSFWEAKMLKKKEIEIYFEKKETDIDRVDPGYCYSDYYNYIVQTHGEFFFYNNAIYKLGIVKEEIGHSIAFNVVNSILRNSFSSEKRKAMEKFLAKFRYIAKKPYLSSNPNIFKSSGELVPWLQNSKNLLKDIQIPKAELDLETGRINFFPGIPEINEDVTEEEITDFLKFIKLITKEMFEPFMDFLAQAVLEDRSDRSGRATLLLYGERGSGKSFLVEHVIRSLIPNNVASLPLNFRQFNGFLENKIIYRDENETDEISPLQLYRFAKEMSGATQMSINRKGIESYNVNLSTFFIIISNEKPLSIRDYPTNQFNNQWIAIICDSVLNMASEYRKFTAKYGADLTTFLKRVAGRVIWDVLIPRYKKNMEKYKNTRYGFPIPITQNVRDLCENSKTNYEVISEVILETLMITDIKKRADYLENFTDRDELIKHWALFDSEKPIITNKLLNMFANKRLDITQNKFNTFLKRNKYYDGLARKRIDDVIVRGIYFDKDKYVKDLEKEEVLAKSLRIKDVEYLQEEEEVFN